MQVHVADEAAFVGLVERGDRPLGPRRRENADLVVETRTRKVGVALPVGRQAQAVGLALDEEQAVEIEGRVGQQRLALEQQELRGQRRLVAGGCGGLVEGVEALEELRAADVLVGVRGRQVVNRPAEGWRLASVGTPTGQPPEASCFRAALPLAATGAAAGAPAPGLP
jgi:hypothetical protein